MVIVEPVDIIDPETRGFIRLDLGWSTPGWSLARGHHRCAGEGSEDPPAPCVPRSTGGRAPRKWRAARERVSLSLSAVAATFETTGDCDGRESLSCGTLL